MTNLTRIIHDPEEAYNAKLAAETEFLREVDQHDAGHLITDEAIQRWYARRVVKGNRQGRIYAEFGPPEVVHLNRRPISLFNPDCEECDLDRHCCHGCGHRQFHNGRSIHDGHTAEECLQ